MQIRSELPQFQGQKTLFIVCGMQSGKLYTAFDGLFEEISESRVDDPKYSDNEGFFASGTADGVVTGSVREEDKKEVIDSFLKEFISQVQKLHADEFSHVLVFAPDYMKNYVSESLPHDFKEKVVEVFEGNYVKSGAEDLLKKVQDRLENLEELEPMSQEAYKLLHKGE